MRFYQTTSITDSEVCAKLIENPDDLIKFLDLLADHVVKAGREQIPQSWDVVSALRGTAKIVSTALKAKRLEDLTVILMNDEKVTMPEIVQQEMEASENEERFDALAPK